MAVATQPRAARLGRLDRPALTGVLVREVVNYSSYWMSSTFSSTVEPTIYLLVRVRLRIHHQHDRRVRLRRLRGHRDGGDGGALLERLCGDVRDIRQVPVPAHVRRDSRGACRYGGARHRGSAVDGHARRRVRLCPDARRDGVRARPVVGHAPRALHRRGGRVRLGVLRDLGRWS
jgi:hypothetical protein